MPVTTAEVEAGIRLLLGREPCAREADAIVASCPDRAALCRHLLASDELGRLYPEHAHASLPSPVIVPLDEGVRVVVDLSDHAVGVPIAHRAFEVHELEFVRRTVRPGWHVVDGGAHAGLYALTMARLVRPGGSVHAFEPVAEHAAWLEQGIGESVVQDVVSVVRAALGASTGLAALVRPPRPFSSGMARLRGAGEPLPSSWRPEPIPSVALHDLELPRPVSFLRLDVEGAEGRALEGAARLLASDRPVVLVEIHAELLPIVSGCTPAGLFDRMRALGYTPHVLGVGTVGAAMAHAPASGVSSVVFLP